MVGSKAQPRFTSFTMRKRCNKSMSCLIFPSWADLPELNEHFGGSVQTRFSRSFKFQSFSVSIALLMSVNVIYCPLFFSRFYRKPHWLLRRWSSAVTGTILFWRTMTRICQRLGARRFLGSSNSLLCIYTGWWWPRLWNIVEVYSAHRWRQEAHWVVQSKITLLPCSHGCHRCTRLFLLSVGCCPF